MQHPLTSSSAPSAINRSIPALDTSVETAAQSDLEDPTTSAMQLNGLILSPWLQKLSDRVESKAYGKLNMLLYLPYYLSLAVYAACNLRILYDPLIMVGLAIGFSFSSSCIALWVLISAQVLVAFYNEAIEVMVQCDDSPLIEKEILDQRLSGHKQNVVIKRYFGFMSILLAFALFHDYSTTYTMIQLQLVDFKQYADVPRWLELGYRNVFLFSGIGALGMLQVSNVFKYLTKYLLPGVTTPQIPNIQERDHSDVAPSRFVALFNRCTCYYLEYSPLMAIGMCSGAFLYAYGDYAQLYGGLVLLGILFAGSHSIPLRILCQIAQHARAIGIFHGSVSFLKKILVWSQNARIYQKHSMLATKDRPQLGTLDNHQIQPMLANTRGIFLQRPLEALRRLSKEKQQSGENWLLFLLPRNQKFIHGVANIRYTTKAIFGIVCACLIADGSVALGIGSVLGYIATEFMKVFIQGLKERPSQICSDPRMIFDRNRLKVYQGTSLRVESIGKDKWERILIAIEEGQCAWSKLRSNMSNSLSFFASANTTTTTHPDQAQDESEKGFNP